MSRESGHLARRAHDHLASRRSESPTARVSAGTPSRGRRRTRRHAQIAELIAGRACHPVFQPFVDLAAGQVVGYGALTRFADGRRPDHRNFPHIVEPRPDFVKLDSGLVRGVNADLGRPAMVVAMRHFARTAGCRLIGEGVETDAGARSLTSLGVDFGQGYCYGRPETLAVLTADRGGS